MNIVTLFTRSAYRFLKYIEDSHLGFSEMVRFLVNHREAIVAELVLSLIGCPSRWGGGEKSLGARMTNRCTNAIFRVNSEGFPHVKFE